MRISVITPTCDRPAGIRLAEWYMARQTLRPHEWIVADSGASPAVLTMGQLHMHVPSPPGARNLAGNLLRALNVATGDAVVIWEDDDWYSADHLAVCAAGLAKAPAYGCATLNYFNVEHRCWVRMANRGSALCQTAFRAELIPEMHRAAKEAYAANDFGIDRRFWSKRQGLARGAQTVIGIKGLPGTAGLGIGHRPRTGPGKRWVTDTSMAQLKEWIGPDVENYRCL
jgi:glycosyltransferase involved in cell wall biosynthesis